MYTLCMYTVHVNEQFYVHLRELHIYIGQSSVHVHCTLGRQKQQVLLHVYSTSYSCGNGQYIAHASV